MTTYIVDFQSGGTETSPSIPGKTSISLPQQTIDSTSLPIRLTGLGTPVYGEIQQENFVRLLENFASKTAPPTPTVGMAWFDTSVNQLKIYNINEQWVSIFVDPDFAAAFAAAFATAFTPAFDPAFVAAFDPAFAAAFTPAFDLAYTPSFNSAFAAAFNPAFDARLIASQVVQPGSMMMWPTNTAPAGWLKRNGAAISRTTYASLFAVIGTSFGVGNGATTFNLPDDRGLFERGWDDSRNIDIGRVFGSEQASSNAAHTHTGTTAGNNVNHTHTGTTSAVGDHTHGIPDADQNAGFGGWFDSGGVYTIMRYVATSAAGGHNHTLTTGIENTNHTHVFNTDSTGGTESRPINRAYLPIIKY